MEAVSWEKASFIKESPNGLEAVSHCTRVTPVYDEGRQTHLAFSSSTGKWYSRKSQLPRKASSRTVMVKESLTVTLGVTNIIQWLVINWHKR
jgi:hypothetical protein